MRARVCSNSTRRNAILTEESIPATNGLPLAWSNDTVEPLRPYRMPAQISGDAGVGMFAPLRLLWNGTRGLGCADPMPDPATLESFYRDAYRRVMNKRRDIDNYITSPNYQAQTRSQAAWIKAAAPATGEWLDVGAGYGMLLHTVRREMPDWRLTAVEPDNEAEASLCALAILERDFAGFWERRVLSPSAFDVISLSHVFEHLIDPVSSLMALRHYLKTGGLLMIEVPNDTREELMREARTSDLPHLWFFSHSGLVALLSRAGFDVLRSAEIGIRRPGSMDPIRIRARRILTRQLYGPLAILDDRTWYAEGPDRCDLRILARKRELSH
ncbi:class I SAM-dependent methyltransferase [Emcibacter sp. SYSU 3D8]|uniref:class I SAM-dependent methyltransferase n=1 Tax=Emcibacter sp. SYSU 3D8 TaxID=3133969 RepID=UPI0031FE7A5F